MPWLFLMLQREQTYIKSADNKATPPAVRIGWLSHVWGTPRVISRVGVHLRRVRLMRCCRFLNESCFTWQECGVYRRVPPQKAVLGVQYCDAAQVRQVHGEVGCDRARWGGAIAWGG